FLASMQQTSDGGYILGGFSSSNTSGDKSEDSRGYSDYWVVKTDAGVNACETPTDLTAEDIKSNEAKLEWKDVDGAQSYDVNYKVKGTTAWTSVMTDVNQIKLEGLSPDTKYLWRVRTFCETNPKITSLWSPTSTFITTAQRM